MLGESSEALYHAQALSTAEYKWKLSLPPQQEVGRAWARTLGDTLTASTSGSREEGGRQPEDLGDKNWDSASLTQYVAAGL